MSTIIWPKETDDFLISFAETMSIQALFRSIKSDCGAVITKREIVARCKHLGINAGSSRNKNPQGIENHLPSLKKGFDRREWDEGVHYRCALEPALSGGYASISIHTMRGDKETTERRYAPELLGAGNPVANDALDCEMSTQ